MITILHGDHIEASRKELNSLKLSGKGKEMRFLDGKNLDEAALVQAFESSSLFADSTLTVVERLFGPISKNPKKADWVANLLNGNIQKSDIIVWEDKTLTPALLKKLDSYIIVRSFTIPVIIFTFLDSIRPLNSKNMLSLFTQLKETDSAELVFSMIVKRIRMLIQLKDNVSPPGLADWQKNRLTSQVKSFTMDKLVSFYRKLYLIDSGIKKGISPLPMDAQIELLITAIDDYGN